MSKKFQYLAIVFKKFTYRGITTVKLFVRLVSSRVMNSATIEHESPAITRGIFRQPAAVRK